MNLDSSEAHLLVARAERVGVFTARSDCTTLDVDGRTYQAGRFTAPTLDELRAMAETRRVPMRARTTAPKLRFDVLPERVDVALLQATAEPGSLFQVASQFNCLESPGPFEVPVSAYFHDRTQGPRAALSAFPGALLRHVSPRTNLLEAVCGKGVATVEHGYLTARSIAQPAFFADALGHYFGDLRVGLHEDLGVAFAPPGATPITQVLCSTLAGGCYGDTNWADPPMARIVQALQRAAYFGTLCAAAALGKRHVILTSIGGGVFGNPPEAIARAMDWAMREVTPLLHRDIDVVLNGLRWTP